MKEVRQRRVEDGRMDMDEMGIQIESENTRSNRIE